MRLLRYFPRSEVDKSEKLINIQHSSLTSMVQMYLSIDRKPAMKPSKLRLRNKEK